ncbi:MAG: helix-turn-helix domain-containing protein [Ruminococcus sp.]|nr:helix-turn-helix domain-containing protein [Ruminococcus sp.]
MDINVIIKRLREHNGYTQKNIADYLNVDQSFISKVEKGDRAFTSDMVDKIAALFGVSVSSLVSKDFDKAPSTVCSFRTSDLSSQDLQTIAVINKIAINADFMSGLLGENDG